jgi:hypothetical protein
MEPDRAWPFLSLPHHPLLSALWSTGIHGILAVLAVGPVLLSSDKRIRAAGAAFLGASAVDLDHPLAAESVSLTRMESMSGRPPTHGLLFAAALALLALAWRGRLVLAWAVFAVVSSHLVFDAAGGGTPLLFPLAGINAIPWLACPAGVALLAAASRLLVRNERARLARAGAATSEGG